MTAPDATPFGTLDDDHDAALDALDAAGRVDDAFRDRFEAHFPRLHASVTQLYPAHPERQAVLADLVVRASASWNARPLDLKVRDGQHLAHPDRLTSERMLGGACDAGRYGGNLAGVGDQIPYLRELGLTYLHLLSLFEDGEDVEVRVDPGLGTLDRLGELAADLRLAGISLGVDVPAPAGVALDGPEALGALARVMLLLANRGAEVLRIDAPASVGADASPARGALLVSALDAVRAMAAPGTVLSASVSGGGLVDDDLPATLVWEALATGDGRLTQRALDRRAAQPDDATRVTSVRSQDALRWGFSDEDAAALGIDAAAHRRFLTDFYTGVTADAFARGLRVEGAGADGPAVAGTTASLAGVEAEDAGGEDRVVLAHALALSAGGLPVLWLGDEVAQLNDYSCADDPERRDDVRWVHRGHRPRDRYAARHDDRTAAGRIHRRLTKLVSVRQATPELAGGEVIGFHTPHTSVIGYQRPAGDRRVLVLANVGTEEVTVDPLTLSGFERIARDLLHECDVDLDEGVTLPPLGVTWLRVSPL